jgi:hypothetical protein
MHNVGKHKGIGTILANVIGGCVTKLYHFCGGILNVYANVVALEEGRCVHQYQSGLELNVLMRSSLVDMYAKCKKTWRMFGLCSTSCHLEKCGNLDYHTWRMC